MPTLARTLLAAAAGGDAVAPFGALGAEALAAARLGPSPIDGARLDGTGLDTLLAPLATGVGGLLERAPLAHRLAELLGSSEGWTTLACLSVAGGVAIGVLRHVARRLRPTGRLSLRIGFPEAIEGCFAVRLRRRGGGRTRGQQRSAVRRETQFDEIAVGLYALELEGELRAPRSQAVLARIRDTLEVRIEPDGCTEIDHRLPAVEPLVEFRIHWDRRPARDVGLCLDGRPQSLRYAAQGQLKTSLALGEHRLVVGAGDRVIERSVVIDGYEPKVVHMDLASPEGLVFKGCPPAVNAFLQGDLGAAARALERDGQGAVGSLLLARLHQEQGQSERAAERLENAGRWRDAAELRRGLGHHDRAARLFERAGQPRDAASAYEAAESWAAAARAHQAVQAFSDAARCWERAGEPRARIDALEAAGDFFPAAAIASEIDDRARAIRLLQQIGPKDPDFGRAGELLALAFEQEGHHDLAARQLERRIELLAPGESAPQLEIHLAELLEESHEYARALEILQSLREREPTWPNVASRIETLRKKLSGPLRSVAYDGFPSQPLATAFVAASRYEILEEIGRGGMGRVYKARDRRLGRIVALKRMPEGLRDHPAALQLFLGEAQAAARMNHPNIVTLYDADQERGQFFITMELLEGLPLSTILRERGRLGPRDTARIGLQACAGLQYAHDQGIVHRDVKTANLFLTRDRTLKIMDFGLAKILEAVRETGSTIIAGTPDYMAPEQTAGRVSDGRTDLYGLGVTLFELSTGRLPFRDGDVAEQHRSAPRPDPSTGLPDYPPTLARLVLRMLSPDPAERPASAAAVAAALTAILDAEARRA
ncbi:MAG: serine/threonine-protein kinase [Myxococcota bacterium]